MTHDPGSAGWARHSTLERDTIPVGDLPLCRALLINDANYPWLLLVPRRENVGEIIDLEYIEQAQLMSEIAHAARTLKAVTKCDKTNVAALGNVVPQLHIHVIARFRNDPAWPKPVWNAVPPRAYDDAALKKIMGPLKERLTLTAV